MHNFRYSSVRFTGEYAQETGRDYALDSSLGMQTPEGIEYVLFPAGIPIRVCAWAIDSVIKAAALFVLLIVFAFLDQVLGVWILFIVNFALNWFYFSAFDLLWNGQSPGKRIMGIRVVGSDGSPVTAGSSFLRNLLRFADGFFFLYLIAFICMAASPGFRRLGDWAGNTLVVYTSSRLSGRLSPVLRKFEAIPWLRDIPAIVPDFKLNYEEKQALLMFARRYPLLGKERADEIARPWVARLLHNPQDSAVENPAVVSPASSQTSVVSESGYLLGIAHTISGIL